ncbi:target of rapamycin kinase (TOR) kinase 3, putative [Trypanosoma cruzi]|nr:target of rapamycin kinase (TOR) kinase 3, putative [Trypanosoma cruzi]
MILGMTLNYPQTVLQVLVLVVEAEVLLVLLFLVQLLVLLLAFLVLPLLAFLVLLVLAFLVLVFLVLLVLVVLLVVVALLEEKLILCSLLLKIFLLRVMSRWPRAVIYPLRIVDPEKRCRNKKQQRLTTPHRPMNGHRSHSPMYSSNEFLLQKILKRIAAPRRRIAKVTNRWERQRWKNRIRRNPKHKNLHRLNIKNQKTMRRTQRKHQVRNLRIRNPNKK